MKKSRGFTLIELLIVTVVIVTLMAIVFRLAGTGSDSTKRAETLARLQKLSNALSGYYAAFGSYPPVPLQGRSRDIYRRVDDSPTLGYGIQSPNPSDRNEASLTDDDKDIKRQIEAACRAQPVGAGYPYNPQGDEHEAVLAICEEYGFSYKLISSEGGFNIDKSDWGYNHVFMFGLLSFLLPRYYFMLDGPKNLYNNPKGPWMVNNRLPYRLDGKRPSDWAQVQKWLRAGPSNSNASQNMSEDEAMIRNLSSQAVCARWMPNFKELVASFPVRTVTEFFGVETQLPFDKHGSGEGKWFVVAPGGYGHSPAYVNCLKTVVDGWGNELYYYSPPPYQSYQLWSSGENGRTFPPWMEPKDADREVVNKWIADDVKLGDK